MAAKNVAKRRLKVVFLHGLTQSDVIFKQRTCAFKTACASYIEIKYVNAPHLITKPIAFHDETREGKEDTEIKVLEDAAREQFIKERGVKEDYGRTWFSTGEPGLYSSNMRSGAVIGLEESFKAVYDACKEHEAEGIMGFSLGGLMTTLATQRALKDDTVGWKPKFCVVFSGPTIGNQEVNDLLEKGGQIDIPSLHMICETDPVVRPERSHRLMKYYKDPEIGFHNSDHSVPYKECKDVLRGFFSRMRGDTVQ